MTERVLRGLALGAGSAVFAGLLLRAIGAPVAAYYVVAWVLTGACVVYSLWGSD